MQVICTNMQALKSECDIFTRAKCNVQSYIIVRKICNIKHLHFQNDDHLSVRQSLLFEMRKKFNLVFLIFMGSL